MNVKVGVYFLIYSQKLDAVLDLSLFKTEKQPLICSAAVR